MPSFTVFGIKINSSQTAPEYANKNHLHSAVNSLLNDKLVEKVVIKKNFL